MRTVYYESFEAEEFCGFRTCLHVRETLIWKFKIALFKFGFKRNYEGFRKSLGVQLTAKLFYLDTFMVYGNYFPLNSEQFVTFTRPCGFRK